MTDDDRLPVSAEVHGRIDHFLGAWDRGDRIALVYDRDGHPAELRFSDIRALLDATRALPQEPVLPSNEMPAQLEVPADAPTPRCNELPWGNSDQGARCRLPLGHAKTPGYSLHRDLLGREFVSRSTIAEAQAMQGDNG